MSKTLINGQYVEKFEYTPTYDRELLEKMYRNIEKNKAAAQEKRPKRKGA